MENNRMVLSIINGGVETIETDTYVAITFMDNNIGVAANASLFDLAVAYEALRATLIDKFKELSPAELGMLEAVLVECPIAKALLKSVGGESQCEK